jgi:hypothetical protein
MSQGLVSFFAFGGTGCVKFAYVKMIKRLNGQKEYVPIQAANHNDMPFGPCLARGYDWKIRQ